MRRDDAYLLDMLLAARDAVEFAGKLTSWKFRLFESIGNPSPEKNKSDHYRQRQEPAMAS